MRSSLKAMFAHDSGQMQIVRLNGQGQFLHRFPAGAGVRRFAFGRVQLASGRTPQPAIRLLCPFQQQHFVTLVKAIKQSRDFVGKRHAVSETTLIKSSKLQNPAPRKAPINKLQTPCCRKVGAWNLESYFPTQYNLLPVRMNRLPSATAITERRRSSPSSPIGMVRRILNSLSAATMNTSPLKFWK